MRGDTKKRGVTQPHPQEGVEGSGTRLGGLWDPGDEGQHFGDECDECESARVAPEAI